MAVLRSSLFKDDPRLEACATTPGTAAHLTVGSPPGPHIAKVQKALETLRPAGPAISSTEKARMSYGDSTAAAVLHYKRTHSPPIINRSYQSTPDAIIGQMTIRAMDDDLVGNSRPGSEIAVANALAALPRYISTTIRALTELTDPGGRKSSLSDLAEDAVRRFFRSDPSTPAGQADLGIILGAYRVLQNSTSSLRRDLHINDPAKDRANQQADGEKSTAAYAQMTDAPDEAAGIYVNPSAFEPLNELRRTGIVLHEMGHFYLSKEDKDPATLPSSRNILENNISYDWTAFQINFGRRFREDVQ